jgi:hypothetical protein
VQEEGAERDGKRSARSVGPPGRKGTADLQAGHDDPRPLGPASGPPPLPIWPGSRCCVQAWRAACCRPRRFGGSARHHHFVHPGQKEGGARSSQQQQHPHHHPSRRRRDFLGYYRLLGVDTEGGPRPAAPRPPSSCTPSPLVSARPAALHAAGAGGLGHTHTLPAPSPVPPRPNHRGGDQGGLQEGGAAAAPRQEHQRRAGAGRAQPRALCARAGGSPRARAGGPGGP